MANFVSKYSGAQHDEAVRLTGELEGKVTTLTEEIEELKDGGTTTEAVTKTGVVVNIEAKNGESIQLASNTGEAVTLIHHGKNFLPPFSSSGTKNGISFSTNEDGSVNVSGTATADTWLNFPANKQYPYLPAGKYVASCECEGLENNIFYICIEGNYKSGGEFYGFLLDSNGKKVTGTVDAAYEPNSYIFVKNGTTVNACAKYQLELGDAATEFEPYKAEVLDSQTFPVTVAEFGGTDVLYTKSGDTITASYGKKSVVGTEWVDKKWVCVGDSLTEANIRADKRYHDYVAEATGIQVVNLGKSGTGYKQKEDQSLAFYQRISSVPTDADVVTIFGSGNDLSHTLGTPTDTGTETICGCINTTIDNLIAIMPAVSLGIVAPTPWTNYNPATSGNAMALYVEALKTICANRSIPFLDLYHCSNLRPWTEEGRAACYSKDDGNGTHPDESGHKLIAPRFKAFLETLIM